MYTSDLKLLLRFRTTSLYEGVSQSFMEARGSDASISLASGGQGYMMQTDQYLFGDGSSTTGFSLGISTAFTLGFWLYPSNVGMVSHPTTGIVESITLPVLDFVSGTSLIRVTEHTTSNETNYLQVDLNDGEYSATTEEYLPSYWHHFWITYEGTSMSVYIDGAVSSLTETGSLPSSISASLADLYINHSLSGYAYNIAKNTAYLGDLCVFDEAKTSVTDIQRAINLGIEYVADDSYTNAEWDSVSLYFNDPAMVTINSAVDDMSFIYMARNDGKILRGSPKFWEARKIYSDSAEASLIGLPSEASTAGVQNTDSVSGGFLKLSGTMVRL
jgi:hypothetical protein